ncbi:MAG: polysaccharide biosynthesis protein [bacterium]|nr:polysaccharide biosynthesis protein [bacterium]
MTVDNDKPEDSTRTIWARLLNRQVQFLLDLLVLISAFVLAYLLRFDFQVPERYVEYGLIQLPLVVLIQFGTLFVGGVYTFIWRYIGMTELTTFLKAAIRAFLPILVLRMAVPESLAAWRVPYSVILMDTLFAFGGVLALRVIRRALAERYETEQRVAHGRNGRTKRVLLAGAGQAGVLAAKEIHGRGDLGLDVRGFVDDDEQKQGSVIHGIKVLGRTRDIPKLVREQDIDQVVITVAQASRRDLRRMVEICDSVPVKARIIPGYYEIVGGTVEISRIRDVEIEDLLGREPVRLEEDVVIDLLSGATVMVTGAGGSIGSELARQVARFGTARLILVERAEFVLFDIDRELRAQWTDGEIVPVVADVGDEERMRSVLAAYQPSVVIHAAAHKHVPMMEVNPTEAVKNNVLATRLIGALAGEYGVRVFIQVSTDKAVRPTSVMGASKRVAELVVQDLNSRYDTRYVSVRFGNVLNSAGSVIPIFREQILAGGPVTVTHPDMVRYFMTIPEASQLVLQAGALGHGGEIFILDMGEPVRIFDMAKDMISLFGIRPFEDIDIIFTGTRPGEKLFEELETTGENVDNTRHPKIFIGRLEKYPPEEIDAGLERLRELASGGREKELRRFYNEFLPEAKLRAD